MTSNDSRDGDVALLSINTLRFLAVDMVERAKSGHPGAPLGQAAMAWLLWTRFLRHDPADPQWPNRDRFILSCGHASALLYGLLHLAGYDLPLAELERFRQLDSKTPGHPEFGHTVGVETTTGPLGQGLATAVGMAIAREQLGARFREDGSPLFDYRTWVLASDGDLMEGGRERGGVARRASPARQPQGPLRRESNLDRRLDRPRLYRASRPAFRCLRLERPRSGRRQRPPGTQRGDGDRRG